MKLFQSVLLILSIVIFSKCDSKKVKSDSLESSEPTDSSELKMTDTSSSIEDFDTFYERFHADSSFQMSRLRFPLKGTDDLGNEWTPNNWNLIKTKVFDVDTTKFRVFYEKTDIDFFQRVWLDSSGFKSECKFELIDGKWYLVYDLEFNS